MNGLQPRPPFESAIESFKAHAAGEDKGASGPNPEGKAKGDEAEPDDPGNRETWGEQTNGGRMPHGNDVDVVAFGDLGRGRRPHCFPIHPQVKQIVGGVHAEHAGRRSDEPQSHYPKRGKTTLGKKRSQSRLGDREDCLPAVREVEEERCPAADRHSGC